MNAPICFERAHHPYHPWVDFLSQVLSLWLPYLLTRELLSNYSLTFQLRLRWLIRKPSWLELYNEVSPFTLRCRNLSPPNPTLYSAYPSDDSEFSLRPFVYPFFFPSFPVRIGRFSSPDLTLSFGWLLHLDRKYISNSQQKSWKNNCNQHVKSKPGDTSLPNIIYPMLPALLLRRKGRRFASPMSELRLN